MIKWTDKDPIEPLLPKTGWLGDYMEFTKNLQACARFRFFSACCVLGAVVNNKVWIQRGDPGLLPKLFPNPWIMLLGPPGLGGKTQTINLAVNCILQAKTSVKILADKLTPESLVQALSTPVNEKDAIRVGPRDATGLIKAPELSVLFGRQQYNVGMISLITDLYDYRPVWSTETIMRGKNELRNNCISILGGSTPDWLQTMLPQDAFTGGFMSRFIIVEMPGNYLKKTGWPTIPKGSVTWDNLTKKLGAYENVKGEFKWTKEAKERYIISHEAVRPTGDRQQDSYREREVEQILKVAMCLALSEETLTFEEKYYDLANRIIKALFDETSARIQALTTHPRMALVQEIRTLLQAHGQMSQALLLQKVHRQLSYGEQQFNEAISVLRRAGIIERVGGDSVNPIYKLTRTIKV